MHKNSLRYSNLMHFEEGEVTLFLIHYAQSQRIAWAGIWADSVLRAAKEMPELTTRAFGKTRMVRNRNRRIAGKYLFQNWARAVGIEITGKLEEFMARNSLIVARFYNQIAAGYQCCMKQARVFGRVFIGWELKDEEEAIVEVEWVINEAGLAVERYTWGMVPRRAKSLQIHAHLPRVHAA